MDNEQDEDGWEICSEEDAKKPSTQYNLDLNSKGVIRLNYGRSDIVVIDEIHSQVNRATVVQETCVDSELDNILAIRSITWR